MKSSRREFIKQTPALGAGIILATGSAVRPGYGLSNPGVLIILDSNDPNAMERSVQWAAQELQAALTSRGIGAKMREGVDGEFAHEYRIVVTSWVSSRGRELLRNAGMSIPNVPESIGLIRSTIGGSEAILATGGDPRGLVYALLELADRSRHSLDFRTVWRGVSTVVEQPANPLRSVTRLFTSEREDKSWFYNHSFWQQYLSMLVTHRFNRFSLTLGLGYDYPYNVLDSYFYFAYPFLLDIPSYQVRALGLPDEERERNLQMLRWISDAAALRGLHFQLGLWTHAYEFIDSPGVNYRIDGLTPQIHGAYCRDALHALLEQCPSINGVTMRCHSESGIAAGSDSFWRTVFSGTEELGRRIEIDIHGKGIEHKLVSMALETGNPVNVSPKAWAEHTGLPYHQAAIRELERAPPHSQQDDGETERSFTRYGYADYLREDRKYGVLHRGWPGTQRVLLSADPALIAGASRYAGFCGSLGLELTEPLSRKGQRGSGAADSRMIYQEELLQPPGGTWEKYLYTYRLWGRLLYSPEADPESWQRFLHTELGPASKDCEMALAHASRLLPLVTSAHLPSANCHIYWPEIYTNLPIVDSKRRHPYDDMPSPKRFEMASPLDPALFLSVEECVSELLAGQRTGKNSPLDVARWLESTAEKAEQQLNLAEKKVRGSWSPAFKRLYIDVKLQIGLARFFAQKFQAGVAYSFYERTGDRQALEDAVNHYRKARDCWEITAATAQGVYLENINFGEEDQKRGHWGDRLPAIEADLADMEKVLTEFRTRPLPLKTGPAWRSIGVVALASAQPPGPRCHHLPPSSFHLGQSVEIELEVKTRISLKSVQLHYRHVNQAETYQIAEMTLHASRYRQTIPGEYRNSPYPLLYFFRLQDRQGHGWLHPSLASDLFKQPYFVIQSMQSGIDSASALHER